MILLLLQFKEYLQRAEYLKGVAGQDGGAPEDGTAATATKVRKPGAKGEDDDKEKEKMKAGLTGAILSEKPNVKVCDGFEEWQGCSHRSR